MSCCACLCVLRTAPAGTAKLIPGYNPATWMLEVTGGAMATLTPANQNVDWPATYQASALYQANEATAQALIEQVRSVHKPQQLTESARHHQGSSQW